MIEKYWRYFSVGSVYCHSKHLRVAAA